MAQCGTCRYSGCGFPVRCGCKCHDEGRIAERTKLESALAAANAKLAAAQDQAAWATAHLGKVWAALTGGSELQTLAPEDVLAAAVRVKREAAERDEWSAKACDDQGAFWADRYDLEHAAAQDFASRLERASAQCDTQRAPTMASDPFQQYRRTQIAELRPVREDENIDPRISISAADRDNGSPRLGDMIARNPANHEDQWLVAEDYFAVNFEPLTTPPTEAPNVEAMRRACEAACEALEHMQEAAWGSVVAADEATEAARALGQALREAGFPPQSPKSESERALLIGRHRCAACRRLTRDTTAGCDHCDLEDK